MSAVAKGNRLLWPDTACGIVQTSGIQEHIMIPPSKELDPNDRGTVFRCKRTGITLWFFTMKFRGYVKPKFGKRSPRVTTRQFTGPVATLRLWWNLLLAAHKIIRRALK